MAVKDIFKISRKTFFAPAEWLGYRQLKETTVTIWDSLKTVFVVPDAARKETFNEAKARLKLTDEDIKEAETNYYFYTWLFMGCGIISFIGGILLLIKYQSFSSLILGLVTTAIFLSQAFRNHFLYFQIKKRKLGCTFEEWKHFTFKSSGADK